MQKFAAEHAFPFPYLIDETQGVSRAYGAVCTPDLFGFNRDDAPESVEPYWATASFSSAISSVLNIPSPMCPGRTLANWRRERDSNPRYACAHNGFRDRPVQPLRHPSA